LQRQSKQTILKRERERILPRRLMITDPENQAIGLFRRGWERIVELRQVVLEN
jgi:hypothetical protein